MVEIDSDVAARAAAWREKNDRRNRNHWRRQMTSPRLCASFLSHDQREMLIDHIDCEFPPGGNHLRAYTLKSLLERNLVEPVERNASPPSATKLTPFGSEVVCIVLGEYADALVRTGYIQERPNISFPHNLPMVAVPLREPGQKKEPI